MTKKEQALHEVVRITSQLDRICYLQNKVVEKYNFQLPKEVTELLLCSNDQIKALVKETTTLFYHFINIKNKTK